MPARHNFNRDRMIRGQRELEALTLATAAALLRAELTEELELLQTRLLSRDPDQLFDSQRDTTDPWTFKPMVELALHHIREAAASELTREQRRREIEWALDVIGF